MASVLIVEDERIVAKDIEHNLRKLHHDVVANVASGDEAIERTSKRRPDLVLMDVHIKGPRDGIETAAILRSNFQVPVVYLTAFADPGTVERAKFTEPLGYLVKPFNVTDLRTTVEIALYKHQMELSLRENEEDLRVTLDSIADAVLTTDAGGHVRRMNPAAETLTGMPINRARGKKFEQVVALRDATGGVSVDHPVADVLEGRSPHVQAEAIVQAEGSGLTPVAYSAAPLRATSGEIRGAVIVLSDMTERHKLESQVAASGRLAAVGTLAAGVAHEINNPLTAVFLGLDLASAWLPDSAATLRNAQAALPPDGRRIWEQAGVARALSKLDAVRNVLVDAQASAGRVRDIVRDLRTFARTEEVPVQSQVSINNVLRSSAHLCSNEIRHRAELIEDYGTVPLVTASESRLGQVFVNLLINAAQSIPHDNEREHHVRITTYTGSDGSAVVEIQDTGVGIPREIRDRIFDPFFTTKPVGTGTGLGLSISLSIIKSLGGRLDFESEPGHGTTFTLTLPTSKEQLQPVPENNNNEPPVLTSGGGRNVG